MSTKTASCVLLLFLLVTLSIWNVQGAFPLTSNIQQASNIQTNNENSVSVASLIQTSDKGYAILCSAESSQVHGARALWLIKTDSTGVPQWEKTYGGSDYRTAVSLVQTNDGGYAIAGNIAPRYWSENSSIFLLKTDAAGNELWEKTVSIMEQLMYPQPISSLYLSSMINTADGGYALLSSSDNRFLLIKMDEEGNMNWNKTYTGNPSSLIQTSTGGYLMAGATGQENNSWLLIMADGHGNQLWSQTYGVPSDYKDITFNSYLDFLGPNSVIQTFDGGFALAGSVINNPMMRWHENPIRSFLLIKTDSLGNQMWDQTFNFGGGVLSDTNYIGRSVVQTSDSSFVIAGTASAQDSSDLIIRKTDSADNELWFQIYDENNSGLIMIQTSDGEFTIAVTQNPDANGYGSAFLLIKLNSLGVKTWSQTYSAPSIYTPYAIFTTSPYPLVILILCGSMLIVIFLIATIKRKRKLEVAKSIKVALRFPKSQTFLKSM